MDSFEHPRPLERAHSVGCGAGELECGIVDFDVVRSSEIPEQLALEHQTDTLAFHCSRLPRAQGSQLPVIQV